ncbi:MAG: hypothetical protein ACTSXD_08530 [Candidatus Heimdallarchaeaceae archaeon]
MVEKKKDKSFKEEVEKIHALTGLAYPSFNISRIDSKELEAFKKLARDLFCNDYGQTLMYLIREYNKRDAKYDELVEIISFMGQDIEMLKRKIESLNEKNKSTDMTIGTRNRMVRLKRGEK